MNPILGYVIVFLVSTAACGYTIYTVWEWVKDRRGW